jgi:hypothetical protein
LEKILTISAEDWCGFKGENLVDYIPRGVHLAGVYKGNVRYFAALVPKEAVIVVGFRSSIASAGTVGEQGRVYTADEKALIPKAKKRR